jgi:hypothetical protein
LTLLNFNKSLAGLAMRVKDLNPCESKTGANHMLQYSALAMWVDTFTLASNPAFLKKLDILLAKPGSGTPLTIDRLSSPSIIAPTN